MSQEPERTNDSSALEAKADALGASLKQMVEHQRKSVGLLKVLCIVLPLFVLGYLSWLYAQVKTFTRPETVTGMVSVQVNGLIPQGADHLKQFIEVNVPEQAEQFLVRGIEQLPKVRERIEDGIVERVNDQLNQVRAEGKAKLQKIVSEHKHMFRDAVKVAADAKKFDEVKYQMRVIIDEWIDQEGLDRELGKWNRLLDDVKRKVVSLHKPKKPLDDEQELERRLIVLARTLMTYTE